MQSSRRRVVAGAAGVAAIGAFPAIVRAQSKVQLKLSHYLPPSHGLHTDFMEPWARELEARTPLRTWSSWFSARPSDDVPGEICTETAPCVLASSSRAHGSMKSVCSPCEGGR